MPAQYQYLPAPAELRSSVFGAKSGTVKIGAAVSAGVSGAGSPVAVGPIRQYLRKPPGKGCGRFCRTSRKNCVRVRVTVSGPVKMPASKRLIQATVHG